MFSRYGEAVHDACMIAWGKVSLADKLNRGNDPRTSLAVDVDFAREYKPDDTSVVGILSSGGATTSTASIFSSNKNENTHRRLSRQEIIQNIANDLVKRNALVIEGAAPAAHNKNSYSRPLDQAYSKNDMGNPIQKRALRPEEIEGLISPQTQVFIDRARLALLQLKHGFELEHSNPFRMSVWDMIPFGFKIRQGLHFLLPSVFEDPELRKRLVHEARITLERASAAAHDRAGGSRMADLLACAAKDMYELDPWWGGHEISGGQLL